MRLELLIAAAASLTDVFRAIGNEFTAQNSGVAVRFNFGASGTLLQQIRAGAPVDVFAPASLQEITTLRTANGLNRQPVVFAANRLVLIAPTGGKLTDWADLEMPNIRRIALSNPKFVPSGRYAQQTLTKRGLWAVLQPKFILGENVRQTLAYVAQHNADAGIVFATDARQEKRVRVIAVAVPGRDHDPIRYPAAVTAQSKEPDAARRFVQYLHSPVSKKLLRQYGFQPE